MKKYSTEKRMVEVEVPVVSEDETQEFMDAIGSEVVIFGMIYIYSGKLVGVNETHIVLENAKIVYETGAFTSPNWKDAQALPTKDHKVRKSAIESWGVLNR